MKPSTFIALALLDVCTAQRGWALEGCDKFDEKAIRASVGDALAIAETAVKVLSEQSGDVKVQSMANFILGNDDAFQSNLDKARGYLENVATYQKDEDTFIVNLGEFAGNTDVIIYCDDSNYEIRNDDLFNKATNTFVLSNDRSEIEDCDQLMDRPDHPVPMAITSTSDGIHQEYARQYEAWDQGGRQGAMPDRTKYTVVREKWPNTMNLCTWFLNAIGKKYFARIDDAAITRAQAEDFLGSFSETHKPIDALASTLAGTLLHELTHTVTGGRSIDVNADGSCYGWKCVGNLHHADNADSISILGICMYLFSKGYWVDDDGNINRI